MFSLTGWSPRIRPEFLVFRLTQVPSRPSSGFRLRGFHPLRRLFPEASANRCMSLCRRSYNPTRRVATTVVWALARSLAATCAITVCFLFLRVLRCFSSPGSPRTRCGAAVARGGLPHSEIRAYIGYLPLGAAYRSLSRPSSPPRAKASFMRPSLLSFNVADLLSGFVCS